MFDLPVKEPGRNHLRAMSEQRIARGIWVDILRYSNGLAHRFAHVAGKLEELRTTGTLTPCAEDVTDERRHPVGVLMSPVVHDTEALYGLIHQITGGFLLQILQLLGVGVGTHADLLARDGLYAKRVRIQTEWAANQVENDLVAVGPDARQCAPACSPPGSAQASKFPRGSKQGHTRRQTRRRS